jgi:GNAT superfamily N-acetyltransferase
VPYQGWVLQRSDDGAIAACGQVATESDMVGLYDVFTHPDHRGRGLARQLCCALLARARAAGAKLAYLQVDGANHPARAVYHRMGFADAYAYHYRTPEAGAH